MPIVNYFPTTSQITNNVEIDTGNSTVITPQEMIDNTQKNVIKVLFENQPYKVNIDNIETTSDLLNTLQTIGVDTKTINPLIVINSIISSQITSFETLNVPIETLADFFNLLKDKNLDAIEEICLDQLLPDCGFSDLDLDNIFQNVDNLKDLLKVNLNTSISNLLDDIKVDPCAAVSALTDTEKYQQLQNTVGESLTTIQSGKISTNNIEEIVPDFSKAEYGKIQVNEFPESDIIEVIDSSRGKQQTFQIHPTGTYKGILEDGTIIAKSDKDKLEIIKDNCRIGIGGNYINIVEKNSNVHIKSSSDTLIDGNATTTIKQNDVKIVEGNKNETVQGDESKTISGNLTIRVSGNVNLIVDGSVNIQSVQNITLSSQAKIILKTLLSKFWKPNTLPNCLFTGAPHSLPTNITGE